MALKFSDNMSKVIGWASEMARFMSSEYITPEHVLSGMISLGVCRKYICNSEIILDDLEKYIKESLTRIDSGKLKQEDPDESYQLNEVFAIASHMADSLAVKSVDVPHVIYGILRLNDSYARYLIKKNMKISEDVFMDTLQASDVLKPDSEGDKCAKEMGWMQYGFYIGRDKYADNVVIGRDHEISRAVMVMCRKEKNNPILIGENGVGKNAVVNGIAGRLASGNVPARLKGMRIFALDMGAVIAGTQFRGEMEKRLKEVMDGIVAEGKSIIFVDNTHDVIGAGRGSDGTMDATSILMPYMQRGDIPFIGATTYENYKKSILKNRNFERMFQKIDIHEPSKNETCMILHGQKDRFQAFHHVTYEDDVIDYAVESSIRYIHDKFLPEKAIDLIDEAGAYREMHPNENGPQTVSVGLVKEILSKMCNIDLTEKRDNDILGMKPYIESKIFGQQEAVEKVCEAVYTSKAGLSDPLKPMASFLFVGPTGVGKTQLAKELATSLDLTLCRFDMSEYSEKNTVTKFIGAPAGYVGYDDGGQLTDAVRKNPGCVLLLDEIEKAHPDIFNLLLQVMDYGTLSDSKGQKTDFRNAIIIMTSNAGARYSKRAMIGFENTVNSGRAMNKEIRSVFSPEFLNRLSSTVIFNDMTKEMALDIASAKMKDLEGLLEAKGVILQYSADALERVIELGYSSEYGAREIDRTINANIKSLLVREILFGDLKEGGNAFVSVNDEGFILMTNQ